MLKIKEINVEQRSTLMKRKCFIFIGLSSIDLTDKKIKGHCYKE